MEIRKEVIGDAVLYLGDCLEVLPALADSVDLIVTDPPYELSSAGPGASHLGMSLGKFDSKEYKDIVSGFNVADVFNALARICEPFNMFCFCSNKQISKIMAFNEAAGRSTNLLVWHKTNAPPFANGVWRNDIEFCVHTKAKGAHFEGNARIKKKVTDHPIVIDSAHPTVKPLPIVEKYIGIGSDIGHTVIDPFMGSGTAGIACANMGRKFIGIEKDEKYFTIACERIENAQRQGKLF